VEERGFDAGMGIASQTHSPAFLSGRRRMPRRIARMYFDEAVGTKISLFSLFFIDTNI
jgi:hypothetical protein